MDCSFALPTRFNSMDTRIYFQAETGIKESLIHFWKKKQTSEITLFAQSTNQKKTSKPLPSPALKNLRLCFLMYKWFPQISLNRSRTISIRRSPQLMDPNSEQSNQTHNIYRVFYFWKITKSWFRKLENRTSEARRFWLNLFLTKELKKDKIFK